ncbi:hypothetical protein Sjap_010989 [Stephania japonica]|uniref:Dicer-like protein 4 n=1 Tax=Stephania japonica TaxID=461633 RepID=A0AAP0JCN8_9MAGN
MAESREEGESSAEKKDPRIRARKYQLELCKKALEENVIVYLGTGCGKTHIAVLLIYELQHLIRKPKKEICVFLAPTVPLVRQQAMVIEESTDFKVGCYYGNSKNLKSHKDWDKEIEKYEVFVMTPQILLHNLFHSIIKMELIVLLIFDECHHAQVQSNHPYAQIMKEYKSNLGNRPRIFGMTASPIVGKAASNLENLPKGINSLESLLDAKVYTVDDKEELERFVSSPEVKVYYYNHMASNSDINIIYGDKLEKIKSQCVLMMREKTDDVRSIRNNRKMLQRLHDNLIFCLINIGLLGVKQAIRFLLGCDQSDRNEIIEAEGNSTDNSLADEYLNMAASIFDSDLMRGCTEFDSCTLEELREPIFSDKLLVLMKVLSTCRQRTDMKCIIFVNRIIVARSLSSILENMKILQFWKCHFLVGFHSGLKTMSRKIMNSIVEKFRSGEINLLVATKVGEEGLDIQTCCLVIRFDLPETVSSFIQSRGRARMHQSEYAFLVERGNQSELNVIENFISDESRMNEEIICRTSSETFDYPTEDSYRVASTGASISAGYSISLLHHYCSKLSHDEFFNPKPEFFYFDDLGGTVCRIILPSNAPIHEVVSLPLPSKDKAKKYACLETCKKLHSLGALTDYLLPGQDDEIEEGFSESDDVEDDNSRGELHAMLIPAALRVPWTCSENRVFLHSYFIQLVPIPADRQYQQFGLFVNGPLPGGAGTMELDLHLSRGRIVRSSLVPLGVTEFDAEEITQAQNFQELCLKIILDRSTFFSDFVPLGESDGSQSLSTFYLLLPVRKSNHENKLGVDWNIIRSCLSSPVFHRGVDSIDHIPIYGSSSLILDSGLVNTKDIMNCLVFTPHNNLFFLVVDILHGMDAESAFSDHKRMNYVEHYSQKFDIHLRYPKQPLLKAKQLFSLHNLLPNRVQENTAPCELEEHFVELPPELCSLKIIGFTKAMGSSLSLLPSVMHRLENLLVAIELKGVFSSAFPEGLQVTENRVIGRHLFLAHDALDEGQLTWKRSCIVKNSNLRKLAIKSNLQVYIRDEQFDPSQFFALGRPCTVICDDDTETTIHSQQENGNSTGGDAAANRKCSKAHLWLRMKTIADVVEALIGAFIVDSGFKAAIAFLKWIGIQVDFELLQVSKICSASKSYMSLSKNLPIADLENSLGYTFVHKGLLVQASVHPSYNKHSGGCYQRLEFLGDAVLDYLITSYLYSVYPKLKPGQLTDLRSASVNNNSFAHVAVSRGFHKYLISGSDSLSDAVNKFVDLSEKSCSKKSLSDGLSCPKVLGDLVESYVGAILLDSGFNLNLVWKIMLYLLAPVLNFSTLQLDSIRELQELCQSRNWKLNTFSTRKGGIFSVKVVVNGKDFCLSGSATNSSKKVATRLASQEIFLNLKAKGYKSKRKSLEDVLKSSIKQEATLIGFDEATMESLNTSQLGNLEGHDTSLSAGAISNIMANNDVLHHRGDVNFKSSCTQSTPATTPQWHQGETNEDGSSLIELQMGGMKNKWSAKSHLFELCASNSWNPPFFECINEEGPHHLKLFAYRVRVEVEDAKSTILECYSEPQAKKKAAQEQAAEGALCMAEIAPREELFCPCSSDCKKSTCLCSPMALQGKVSCIVILTYYGSSGSSV